MKYPRPDQVSPPMDNTSPTGNSIASSGVHATSPKAARNIDPTSKNNSCEWSTEDPIHQTFSVHFEYPVCFTENAFALENSLVIDTITKRDSPRPRRVLVWIDDGVAKAWPDLQETIVRYFIHYQDRCQLARPPQILPGGEAAKNQSLSATSLESLYLELHRHGLDRHDVVLTIGGGALLDATGFVAATTHRGIRHLRMPTTVLSQNDSGVGVKNGLNAFGCKNFIGAFAPPFAVINDNSLLRTLDPRDQVSGMAEAVKVAAILDSQFFFWLESNCFALASFEVEAVKNSIRRGAELHLQHIRQSGDAFEQGNARPLDFGHWAAHKLESMTKHQLRHGEAVAIGIMIDTRYSVATRRLSRQAGARMEALLTGLRLPTHHEALGHVDTSGKLAILEGLEDFRQHLGGELSITLLESIGHGVQVNEVDVSIMSEVCRSLARAEGSADSR